MKTYRFTPIRPLIHLPIWLFVISSWQFVGCSRPPVIRHKVNAGHVRLVDQTFLKRANQVEVELAGAKTDLANHGRKTELLRLDLKLARTGLLAAELQLRRAALVTRLMHVKVDAEQVKPPTQADQELELARKTVELAELNLRYNVRKIEMLQWKVYTRTAQLLEEQVLAMYKAQVAVAGVYHKVTYVDQTYRVRRKFLLLEEKLVFMTLEVEALRKRIDVAWNPVFGRSALFPVCNPCEAAPVPSAVFSVDESAPVVDGPSPVPAPGPSPVPAPGPVQPGDTRLQ